MNEVRTICIKGHYTPGSDNVLRAILLGGHSMPSMKPTTALRHTKTDQGVMVVRQPVMDLAKRVYGYQLLYDTDTANDPTCAIREVMHIVLNIVGIEAMVGRNKLFVNVTHDVLLNEDYLVLPGAQTILVLDASMGARQEVLEACRAALGAGYAIGLDHFSLNATPSELVQQARYLIINMRDLEPGVEPTLADKGRLLGRKLILSGIDGHDEFTRAQKMQCQYVQGRFLCEPEPISQRVPAVTQTMRLRLLGELHREGMNFEEVANIIKSDVVLSCGLLRFLNSAALSLPHRITSIQQAIMLLGEIHLRKWGSVTTMSTLYCNHPPELLVASLVRARFCERLALARGLDEEVFDAFLTGLLSMLDKVTGLSMENVLQSLPLHSNVRQVLLGDRSSTLSRILQLALASECGAWSTARNLCNSMEIPQHEVAMLYYNALGWARKLYA